MMTKKTVLALVLVMVIAAPAMAGDVVGGSGNTADGNGAAVLGGFNNAANGDETGILGGRLNVVDGIRAGTVGGLRGNAAGNHAALVGGIDNDASGNNAAILAGRDNVAAGHFSAVVGGLANVAGGRHAVATGHHAHAIHPGTFVFSDTLSDVPFSSTAPNQFLIDASGGVGIGTNSPTSALTVNGDITPGTGGQALGQDMARWGFLYMDSVIDHSGPLDFVSDGSTTFQIEPVPGGAPNIFGAGNEPSGSVQGAVIGGGGGEHLGVPSPNTVLDDWTVIGGGRGNTAGLADGAANGAGATIGGGAGNAAAHSFATVSGGSENSATGAVAAIGGGSDNVAAGLGSTVAGGNSNEANGGHSSIGGGQSNVADGFYSAAAGGIFNAASGHMSAVGGGSTNAASGEQSTVGGGELNEASGDMSTVAGGYNNVASGQGAVVPGGRNNQATAAGAIAIGEGAEAGIPQALAQASGSFETTGDAQALRFVLKATTNGFVQTLKAGVTTKSTPNVIDRTMTFEALIAARAETGQSAAYLLRGMIAESSPGVYHEASTLEVIYEDDPSWNVQFIGTSGLLDIRVEGSEDALVRWVATVTTAQVEGPSD